MPNVKDKFRSKRNGKLATVIKVTKDHGVILEIEGEEEYKLIAEATLQRWYEPITMYEPPNVPQEPETNTIMMEPVQEQTPKTPKKTTKKPTQDCSYTVDKCLDFINKMKEQYGITIYNEGKNKNFYSLKADGKIYMAFTVSKHSGVNLWLRSKAVEGICEFKKLNHMLDARVTISDWGMDTYQLMVKLHDASLKYQLEKNKVTKK